MVDDSGGGAGTVGISKSTFTVNSGSNVISVFAKANGESWLDIRTFSFDAGGDGESYFDLGTGVVWSYGTAATNMVAHDKFNATVGLAYHHALRPNIQAAEYQGIRNRADHHRAQARKEHRRCSPHYRPRTALNHCSKRIPYCWGVW